MRILVTGGAGFIGSAVVRLLASKEIHVLNVDALTYASNLNSLAAVEGLPHYQFVQANICDEVAMSAAFSRFKPDVVMHLAAETHVDRSIDGPAQFIQSNIVGTFNLLQVAHEFWRKLDSARQQRFRFHHVSTDEVYGDLGINGEPAAETARYLPSSPYAASKASADHLVRAWSRTYGLPILITNCCNNYGPFQFPEKLIPLVTTNALAGKPLPVFGDGKQVREWLFVEDHAQALFQVICHGRIGETYNIGGNQQKRNIDVIHSICDLLEELVPVKPVGVGMYRDLVRHVQDRPGHDTRYAIDGGKIESELGWTPVESFESGLRKTVQSIIGEGNWRLNEMC